MTEIEELDLVQGARKTWWEIVELDGGECRLMGIVRELADEVERLSALKQSRSERAMALEEADSIISSRLAEVRRKHEIIRSAYLEGAYQYLEELREQLHALSPSSEGGSAAKVPPPIASTDEAFEAAAKVIDERIVELLGQEADHRLHGHWSNAAAVRDHIVELRRNAKAIRSLSPKDKDKNEAKDG